jgi:DNA-binding NtrC family response regulator
MNRRADNTVLPRVLVIDDLARDPHKRDEILQGIGGLDVEGVGMAATDPDVRVTFCTAQREIDGQLRNDLEAALEVVQRGPGEGAQWALILLDMEFRSGKLTGSHVSTPSAEDDRFGEVIRNALGTHFPHLLTRTVFLTHKHQREVADLAAPYLRKSSLLEADAKQQFVEKLLHFGHLSDDQLRRLLGLPEDLFIESAAMRRLYVEAYQKARSKEPILIVGETGTGKTKLAGYIHRRTRPKGPFVSRNVATVPENLMASTVFGHWAGAFDGAKESTPGWVEQANGGVLFLDEVHTLTSKCQTQLHGVIDHGLVQRVGIDQKSKTSPDIPVDVLILSATLREPDQLVRDGQFNNDTLRRLRKGGQLHVPPLRERRDEIRVLATRFLATAQKRVGRSEIEIHPDALDLLEGYDFPGNVGDLESTILQLVTRKSSGAVITRDDVDGSLREKRGGGGPAHSQVSGPTPAPDPVVGTSHSDASLDSLLRTMGSVEIGQDVYELRGALNRFDEAADRVRRWLAGAALCARDENPTEAFRLLVDSKTLPSNKAKDELSKLVGGQTGRNASPTDESVSKLVEEYDSSPGGQKRVPRPGS